MFLWKEGENTAEYYENIAMQSAQVHTAKEELIQENHDDSIIFPGLDFVGTLDDDDDIFWNESDSADETIESFGEERSKIRGSSSAHLKSNWIAGASF